MRWIILILLLPAPALADFTISTINWSEHFSKDTYNETHYGLMFEYDSKTVDQYINSEGNRSNLVGIRESWAQPRGVDIGFVVALVDGYERANILPFAAISVRYEHLQLGFIPGEIADETNVVYAGFYFNF